MKSTDDNLYPIFSDKSLAESLIIGIDDFIYRYNECPNWLVFEIEFGEKLDTCIADGELKKINLDSSNLKSDELKGKSVTLEFKVDGTVRIEVDSKLLTYLFLCLHDSFAGDEFVLFFEENMDDFFYPEEYEVKTNIEDEYIF